MSEFIIPAPPGEGDCGAVIYAREALRDIPRLLSTLDREPDSASYGCFDREYWGWKFRDFPITMLQSAVHPLALLWNFSKPNNSYYRSPQLLAWIAGGIQYACRRQHANGAFDSVGPNTQDHGVSLAMVYHLVEAVRALGGDAPAELRLAVAKATRKACRFALRSSEDYAFISNHRGFFVLAYLNAHWLLGDSEYLQRAETVVDEIIRQQSPDGWYREYEGPDPGYESLGISYLALYWQRTRSPRLLDSLRRSIAFYAHCVHPDGSVGGLYGSRHTSLYYPSGFELLAAEIPLAGEIARYLRARIGRNNVVTPAVADAENLPSLTVSYLTACLARDTGDNPPLLQLPCETLEGLHHFSDSGITVAGSRRYYAVVNAGKGGVCRAFDKHAEKVAYEDAGYVVRTSKHLWTSQIIGLGRRVDGSKPNEVACTTVLAEVRQELPTPAKFLLLRLLNLTLFRNLRLGAWIRLFIIRRLILEKRRGPLRLERIISFDDDEIRFHDSLHAETPVRAEEVILPRAFTAIHMGSAKYFNSSSLEATPVVPVGGMADDLRRNGLAQCEFTIRFRAGEPPELVPELVLDTVTPKQNPWLWRCWHDNLHSTASLQ